MIQGSFYCITYLQNLSFSVPTEVKFEIITIIPGRIHVDVGVNVTIMAGNYK